MEGEVACNGMTSEQAPNSADSSGSQQGEEAQLAAEPGAAQAAETAGPSEAGNGAKATSGPPLSRNQQKKLARQERYLASKPERKAAEKAKQKAARVAKKNERDEEFRNMTDAQKKAAMDEAHAKRRARKVETQQKQDKMKASLAEGNQRLAIDLDFESFMVEADQRHLCQQLSYSYSANSKVERPCHFHLLGLKGGLCALAEKALPGMAQWHITRSELPWNEFFKDKLDQVVYLTADSPNELDDLDSSKVYVIGGLVDHNQHKGICYKRALAAGVATARLPITKHVKLESSAVLTVNHVVQLIAEYVNRRDWAAVLNDVLPKRKRADFKTAKRMGAAVTEDEGVSTGPGDGAAEEEGNDKDVGGHGEEEERQGQEELRPAKLPRLEMDGKDKAEGPAVCSQTHEATV